MNMKTIIALAGVAVATVAGASTNYVKYTAVHRHLYITVQNMTRDPALSDPAAFRAALEELDRATATGKIAISTHALSRRCPLSVRAALEREAGFSAKVRGEMIAHCGYDAKNIAPFILPSEPDYVNSRLQLACLGQYSVAAIRSEILNAAIVPTRRAIRRNGGSFVGKEGAAKVKEMLDALADELNAPRFGKADEALAKIGIDVEMDFIRSKMPTDEEVASLRTKLLDGEIPFPTDLQYKLCVVLGVKAYNEFVKEYNGK